MPPTSSSAICLFSAIAASMAATATAAPQPLDVIPAPAEARVSAGRIAVSANLVAAAAGVSDARLDAAIARAGARWRSRIGGDAGAAAADPVRLSIDCKGPGAAVPSLAENESYTLDVGQSQIVLRAATAVGAMRGLETLLQLPSRDREGWYLPAVSIRDAPRFPWRGLLIDVGRHWEPVEVIERNLDAMAVVKLNVLHLHLTEDQGFRIESLTHPELQAKGSDGLYFTQAQVRGIIAYAAARGIRVVPEFDIPGHTTSWVVSHPELASLPGPYGIERHWGVFNPVLDPTNEATYALLGDFLGEMAALFPDSFIHIGGDENNGIQWNANPRIQAFIREHGLKDNGGLHTYFNGRIVAMLAKDGKRLVGWDEIFHPGLPQSSVIHSWRGTDALAAAAALGYDGILSNGYYVNLCYPASQHYLVDPLPASSTLTPAQRSHILGGEATMWGEWVTPETIDSKIWPRTAAIAERLWSPQGVRDVGDMYRRLAAVSDRLDEAGSLHRRNRDVMLRHLIGENLDVPGVDSLRSFLAVIEEVKGYRRGALQIWSSQIVPLVGIADASQPESMPARDFAGLVDRMLFAPGGIDPSLAGPIADRLGRWGSDGEQVADVLSAEYPALREAVPTARGLANACEVGGDAVRSLTSGRPIPSQALSDGLARLDRAAEANLSATELPILAPIRLLVVAAAELGERPKLSDAEWRTKVSSGALPAPPAETH